MFSPQFLPFLNRRGVTGGIPFHSYVAQSSRSLCDSSLIPCGGFLLVLSLCGCGATISTVAPSATSSSSRGDLPVGLQNYALAFSDDFAGDTLDMSKWNYRTGVRLLSEQLPSNVVAGSNALEINVGQQQSNVAPWTGGGVASVPAFRYGYYQVDAQVTANPGWHTSFWTSGNDATTTEIDGFEIDTQSPTRISMGLHSWVNGNDTDPASCNSNSNAQFNSATAMHSYGFEWTEQGISYYLDGNKVCTESFPATTYTHSLVNIRLSSVGYTANVISTVHNPSPNIFSGLSYFVRDYYVNALEPGYTTTGSWSASALTGFSHLPTQASNVAGSSAQYTPNILTAGNYDVQVWKTQSISSDTAAPIKVTYSGGSATTREDFTAGESGWIDLGTYPFAAGSSGDVTIGYSGTGYARSSMVKFVRR